VGTGIRGLPYRVGAAAARWTAVLLLVAGTVVALRGPAGIGLVDRIREGIRRRTLVHEVVRRLSTRMELRWIRRGEGLGFWMCK